MVTVTSPASVLLTRLPERGSPTPAEAGISQRDFVVKGTAAKYTALAVHDQDKI